MSDRLRNALRILDGGASDRRRTQMGIGPDGAAPIGVHRIVEVGSGHSAAPAPAPEPVADDDPRVEVVAEDVPSSQSGVALVLYAPEGEALLAPERRVNRIDVALPLELDPRLVLLCEPESSRAQSFRLLAHRLRHGGNPRVVLVTSPRPGEGKTTTALNLALALAEDGGDRVLLIEANARTPSLAALFGISDAVGLPRQMARRETALVPWTAWDVAGTGLSVMPADPEDEIAPSRATFRAVTDDLTGTYDYIVVDSPSALESADVMALVDSVDAIVLAARAKKTRVRELERTRDQLAPGEVLGVVLLDIREAARS
jgi:Mrp family chromosome partitioning ATPase